MENKPINVEVPPIIKKEVPSPVVSKNLSVAAPIDEPLPASGTRYTINNFFNIFQFLKITGVLIFAIGTVIVIYFGTREFFGTLLYLNTFLNTVKTCIDDHDCIHGDCVLGTCQCEIEWTGTTCNTTAYICATGYNEDACNDNGDCYLGICICDIGWTGTYCNETADMCISSNDSRIHCYNDDTCNGHGDCWFGRCICEAGWYGDLCESNTCPENLTYANCTLDTNCTYGGTQSGTCYYGLCYCYPNYVGNYCELQRRDFSFCDSDADCLNNGKCYENNHGNGECYCRSSTTGNNCET